ncbi:hypothetical protein DL765_010752 [Monosporascus sp. GIB2]|nr:hypothetical protein DL765_010752 [Monosporascus sp. GIB2]
MPGDFKRWSYEKDMPSLDGKVIFLTGGTAGLGATTVERLAGKGPAHIYFSGRNADAASSVIRECEAIAPNVETTFVKMDMSSLSSISEALSQTFKSTRLDILVCYAGITAAPCGLSKDGYEIQFAVNFLAHAMIIQRLLPTMLRTADSPGGDVRIVLVTSVGWRAHPKNAIAFDTLRTVQDIGMLGPWRRYGQSKVAAVLYAAELARRYPQITSVSVHPGVVATGLVNTLSLKDRAFVYVGNLWHLDTADEASLNAMWAASSDKTKIKNGNWYLPRGRSNSTEVHGLQSGLRNCQAHATHLALPEMDVHPFKVIVDGHRIHNK